MLRAGRSMVFCVFVFQAAQTIRTSDQGFIVPTIDCYPFPVHRGNGGPKVSDAFGLLVLRITLWRQVTVYRLVNQRTSSGTVGLMAEGIAGGASRTTKGAIQTMTDVGYGR